MLAINVIQPAWLIKPPGIIGLHKHDKHLPFAALPIPRGIVLVYTRLLQAISSICKACISRGSKRSHTFLSFPMHTKEYRNRPGHAVGAEYRVSLSGRCCADFPFAEIMEVMANKAQDAMGVS